MHSAHGGKLKLVWVFTDRGNLEAESRTKWTVTNPGSSIELGPKLKTRTASSSFNGQPISAYVSLLPIAAEYPDQAHRTPTSLILLAASSFILMLYINVHKKPHQQATNCLCVPIFPHLFMDLCHEHDCISDAETESYKSLPSLSIIHRPLRCLQMSSDCNQRAWSFWQPRVLHQCLGGKCGDVNKFFQNHGQKQCSLEKS